MERFFQTSSPDWYALLKANAKKLRENPTEAERFLWEYLRGKQLGVKFIRQHVVLDYIADFICLEHRVIIEVDGGYHNEGEQQRWDEQRTARLSGMGYKVLRYTNEQVLLDIDNVISDIKSNIT